MKHLFSAMKSTVIRWACLSSRRFKFKQICKAIGIKPYWWQKDYALSKNPILVISGGRRSGKTMAVMLRALMHDGDRVTSMGDIFLVDPDYSPVLSRQKWYYDEYHRLYIICRDRGIPVNYIFDTRRLSV